MRFQTVHVCVLNSPPGIGEVASVRQRAGGTRILCPGVVGVVGVVAVVHRAAAAIVNTCVINRGRIFNMEV